MTSPFVRLFAVSAALALTPLAALAQEIAAEPAPPLPVSAGDEPAVNEDEIADYLNSQQQIKQDVTLTRSLNGEVVETRTETVIYSKDDPLKNTEAGVTPLERLKAEFDSQALTRKEALDEAKLDFVVADLDRDDRMTSDEFLFLVKGWEDAEITGAGRGRFVDPYYHVDAEAAKIEHADQARAKFIAMAATDAAITRRTFTNRILADFDIADIDDNELLQGEELLNFRTMVRGEILTPAMIETTPETTTGTATEATPQ